MVAGEDFILANSEGGFVRDSTLLAAAERLQQPLLEMERRALLLGIVPLRYSRNIGVITLQQQLNLRGSCAVVVGCGGLGGYIAEELARLGVGSLRLVDHDVFSESNLNRQRFATVASLGLPKVLVAQKAIAEINGAVTVESLPEKLEAENAARLIAGADIVIDALDNFAARAALFSACGAKRIPIVGGSVAGWYGMVYYHPRPTEELPQIFDALRGKRGIEERLGNPAFTVAIVASLQSALACRILIGAIKAEKAGEIQFLDIETMTFSAFEM